MIVLTRSLARSFRAVLRRCLLDAGPRNDWPVVLARSDGQVLILQACRADIAVRYSGPAPGEAAAIAFRASVLAEFEGRTDAPVTLEQLSPGRGRAQWTEAGVPQAVEFDTVTPDSVPELPEVPARLAAMPEGFAAALGEASRVAAREATRYAVTRVQLRGHAEQDYGRYDDELAEEEPPAQPRTSVWARAVATGCQAAGWWLRQHPGHFSLVAAAGVGVAAGVAALLSGPFVSGASAATASILGVLALADAARAAATFASGAAT